VKTNLKITKPIYFLQVAIDLCSLVQGGHATGKTGNLDVNFSRQGKHREFSSDTGKIVATQGKFWVVTNFAPKR